ncbi:redox-sensing transcriptional repressor Rex, partial [Bacillus sp. SIMBA_161]
FDTNSPKEGKTISGIDTYHPDLIEEKVKQYGVEVVILTVPSRSAQEVTDRLAQTDIKGILNFTPVRISVPEHIRVQTIDL